MSAMQTPERRCRCTVKFYFLISLLLLGLSVFPVNSAMAREAVYVCNKGDIELLYASLGTRVQLLSANASIDGMYPIPPGACRDVMPIGMQNVTVAFFHVDRAGQLGNVVYSLEGAERGLKKMGSDRMCVERDKFQDSTSRRRLSFSQFVQSWTPPCSPGRVSVKNTFMAWGGTNSEYTINLRPSLDDLVTPLTEDSEASHQDDPSRSYDKKFDDGSYYVGQLKDGVPHGQGVMRWPDGGGYEGEWRSGNREGGGRATWPDGRTFSGSWEHNEPQRGRWTIRDGRTFTGQRVDGLPDGYGTLTLPDGRKLEGDWKQGVLETGEPWVWPDRQTPRGGSNNTTQSPSDPAKQPTKDYRFTDHHAPVKPPTDETKARTQAEVSIIHKTIFDDGAQYEGQMKEGVPHGRGVMEWPDGRQYDGEWRSGNRDGQGTMRWPGGRQFSGSWGKNEPHSGSGIWTLRDGRTFNGHLVNDLPEGRGKTTWPDGREYEGNWKDGKPEGIERWKWPDGRTFRGRSKDSGSEQWGMLTWPDGRSFYGPLKDFKPHGEGKVTLPDGSRFKSLWENGVLMKKLAGH